MTVLPYLGATWKILVDKYSEFWDENNNDTTNRLFKKNNLYEIYTTFFSKPTHIIDNLYLGSAFNAANYRQLDDLNVKVVINITKEVSNYFPNKYIYKKYELYDNDEGDIKKYLNEIYDFVEKYNDKNILIHCKMGASRSASFIIFYLMVKHKMDLAKSINFVKEKRMIVNPNCKFIEVLKEYG